MALDATKRLVGPFGVTGRLADIHTEAKNPVGAIAWDQDGNTYKYLPGVASTVYGTWVTYDENGVTIRAVADAQGGVAIAQAALVASTWGWFGIEGEFEGLCLASFADNGKVYLTATAGSVDDADVAGDVVIGAIGRSARDTVTGLATFQLLKPFVMDLAID